MSSKTDNHDYYFFAESNKDISLGLEYALAAKMVIKMVHQLDILLMSVRILSEVRKNMAYIRAKCDSRLTCPFCHRNFKWTKNLNQTRKRYIDVTGLSREVYFKTCAYCDCSFEFAWSKVENKFEYHILEYDEKYSGQIDKKTDEFWTDQPKINNALGFSNEFINLGCGYGFKRLPHIDHVKFNGPATIVFWKGGTKTVVKHDGNGRKDKRLAILYAFIRKIYGEGKPYHNILNEIEKYSTMN